jgi:chaperonin cofactor prefoldin
MTASHFLRHLIVAYGELHAVANAADKQQVLRDIERKIESLEYRYGALLKESPVLSRIRQRLESLKGELHVPAH